MALVLKQKEIEDAIAFLKEAHRVAEKVFSNAKRKIKIGSRIVDIELESEEIIEKDFYLAFPPQISIGSVAAHSCQEMGSEEIIKERNVKLDIGIMNKEGLIFDTAKTFLADVTMGKAVEKALLEAIKMCKPGMKLSEIGKKIEETANSYGFKPIRNLGGHGLNKFKIHDKPTIPNYDNGDNATLEQGMLIAVEPFITKGVGIVKEKGRPTIFSIKPGARSRTNQGRGLIKKYGFDIPFSLKQIKRYGLISGFIELLRNGMLNPYPPLVEITGSSVAQAETTVIVDENPKIFYTPIYLDWS